MIFLMACEQCFLMCIPYTNEIELSTSVSSGVSLKPKTPKPAIQDQTYRAYVPRKPPYQNGDIIQRPDRSPNKRSTQLGSQWRNMRLSSNSHQTLEAPERCTTVRYMYAICLIHIWHLYSMGWSNYPATGTSLWACHDHMKVLLTRRLSSNARAQNQ